MQSATGPPLCRACNNQADLCDVCGGRVLAPLMGPASVRGRRWAEEVIRSLVKRWPDRWPRSSKSLMLAMKHVYDLAPASMELQRRLAAACVEAAAKRYAELTDYLMRRRLAMVPGPDDDVTVNPLVSDDDEPK